MAGIFGVGRRPTHLRPCGLGFLPLRGAGTGFVGVLPLALAFDLPENTTLHRETTLKTALELLDTEFTKRFEAKCRQYHALFSREIDHRVYQIYKEGGVVNGFLTAR